MNPNELVKGELYQVVVGRRIGRNLHELGAWSNKIVLYLGIKNTRLHSGITNYCFLLEGEQKLVGQYFLKNIKELK